MHRGVVPFREAVGRRMVTYEATVHMDGAVHWGRNEDEVAWELHVDLDDDNAQWVDDVIDEFLVG